MSLAELAEPGFRTRGKGDLRQGGARGQTAGQVERQFTSLQLPRRELLVEEEEADGDSLLLTCGNGARNPNRANLRKRLYSLYHGKPEMPLQELLVLYCIVWPRIDRKSVV